MRKDEGFTLIELLVVISIVSMLSSIILASLSAAREKARMAKLITFSTSIRNVNYQDVVGDWKFDDTNNIAQDSSGYNHTPDIFWAPTSSNDAVFGKSADMGDQYASIDILDTIPGKLGGGSDSIILEVWIKPLHNNITMGILSKQRAYQLYYLGPQQELDFDINDKFVPATTAYIGGRVTMSTNQWHHIAAVYDKNRRVIRLFFDAQEVKNPTRYYIAPTASSINNDPSKSLVIGYESIQTGEYFAGLLDEIRVYTSSLGF